MVDVATTCDVCGVDIAYNVTCYAVKTGEISERGEPHVRIECATCYRRADD